MKEYEKIEIIRLATGSVRYDVDFLVPSVC
jgi:hypothetical protein